MNDTIYDRLTALGINLRNKRAGQTKTQCPKCSHSRKNKREPCLSVNLDTGEYRCHNDGVGCGFQGNVSERNPQREAKTYTRPPAWTNVTQLSDKLVNWFKTRGISQRTLMARHIAEGPKWFYENSKTGRPAGEYNAIKFPYFRRGELINIKYRAGDKSFMLEKGAELVFSNLDAIEQSEEVTIVEGEIDELSHMEIGNMTVISVPNGATTGRMDMSYLDNCIDYFDNKKKIIIATDDDEAGRALKTELIRRLGAERCWTVNYGQSQKDPNVTWKDSNEVLAGRFGADGKLILAGDGATALRGVLDAAVPCPLEDIVYANDLHQKVVDIYHNGLPMGASADIKNELGIELLTFAPGLLTVVTGIPSHGKSTYLDFLFTKMAVAVDWKFGVFSPENWPPEIYQINITEKLIGKSMSANVGAVNRLSLDEIAQSTQFIQNHFFMINPAEDFSLDGILEKAKQLVRRYGINALVIDPWNTLEHQRPQFMTEAEYISSSLGKMAVFAQRHGIHFFLVAHPTKLIKEKGKKEFPIPNIYNISGGANFANKAHNIMCVYRYFNGHARAGQIEVHVQKVKFRWQGQTGVAVYLYEFNSGRYAHLNSPFDKRNWLITGVAEPQPDPIAVDTEGVTMANPNNPDDLPF